MKTHIKTLAIRTSLFALAVAASAAGCSAQDNGADRAHAITISGGQGGYVVIPDTRAAPQTYALTGEPSPNRQTLAAWQTQAGPVYSVGNARIVIPATR